MVSQATVTQALKLLEQARDRLDQARDLLGASAVPQAPDAGDRVLADVLEQGAAITRDELYAIAARHGMDRRGLGGFFREAGQKSLMDLPGTDRIVLTPYGAERAQRFLNRRRSPAYEISVQPLQRVAESSFAEDWDSTEDSIYDRA